MSTGWKEITKEELSALYETKTTKEIANMFGFKSDETVRKKMITLGIPRRAPHKAREFNPDPAELNDLYQKYSMRDIALKYNVGETVVWKRLRENGIKLRGHEDGGHRKKPGRVFSEEHRENLRRAHLALGARGSKNPNWRGGLTVKNFRERSSPEYKQWRREVLARFDGRCSECGIEQNHVCKFCSMKMKMHVHHIKSFSEYPELRFDPMNGVVLCEVCHAKSHGRKIG